MVIICDPGPLSKQKLGFAIEIGLYFLESNDGAHGHH